MVTGTTNDISQLLYFSFYEPVYYHDDDSPFPSASKECRGRWVGISENVGNFMTFKILTDDTQKIIYRSNLRSARDPNARNLCIDLLNTTSPEAICSLHTASPALDHGEDLSPLSLDDSGYNKQDHLAIVDPYELVGRTFLMDSQDDGQCFCARIVDLVEHHQSKVRKSDHHHKFHHKIIYHSNLCSARDPNAQNLRIDPLNTTSPEVICSLHTASPALDHGEDLSPLSLDDSGYNKQDHLAIVDPYELVGRTFLMDSPRQQATLPRSHCRSCRRSPVKSTQVRPSP
jgi:hypothetical protein